MQATIEKKQCTLCKQLKCLSEFGIHKREKDGHNCWCKECTKKRALERYYKNRERIRVKQNQYYVRNIEKVRDKVKSYRINNIEKIRARKRAYQFKKDNSSQAMRIILNIRWHFYSVFKKQDKKSFKLQQYLDLFGYSRTELLQHIEDQFSFGMCWQNYGQWELDHIKPQSTFKTINSDGTLNIEELKKCWTLINLRPLWKRENTARNIKYAISN